MPFAYIAQRRSVPGLPPPALAEGSEFKLQLARRSAGGLATSLPALGWRARYREMDDR